MYTAVASGTAVQVKRQQIDAVTTDPVTVSLANFGPTIAFTLTNTATLVKRIEAVLPTDGGVIVVTGTHDFTNGYSTLQFWWILADGSAVYQTDALIQADLTEAYAHWYDCATWATYCCAIYDTVHTAIRVIANAHPSGQAVEFSLVNGVATSLYPVLQVDPVYGTTIFRPASVSHIGTLYLLCGRLSYSLDDGSAVGLDCYLTSDDGLAWSAGERNFFLSAFDAGGTLLADAAADPLLLYYAGNLVASRATSTPFLGHNTATRQLSLTPLSGWSLRQTTNAPDNFTSTYANAAGTLTDSAILKAGAVLSLAVGYYDTNSAIGGTWCTTRPRPATQLRGGSPHKSARRTTATPCLRALCRRRRTLEAATP